MKIEYKGDVDLVTVADRKSEALILERIRAAFPNHDVMGEEGTRIETGSDYRWYVDPLDGTTNFAHGYPVFCVSLAVEYKGERIAGVLYDPTRDELFAAEKGSGATLNTAAHRGFEDDEACRVLWSRPDFPATSGTRIQTFISITRSPCAPMECVALARLRSISRTSPVDDTTASGNSISIRGIPRPAC